MNYRNVSRSYGLGFLLLFLLISAGVIGNLEKGQADAKELITPSTAQRIGSKLEFRIAPSPSALSKAELASYMNWLKAGRVGFWWKGGRIAVIAGRMPDHAWLPIADELTNSPVLVTGEYKGQKYVLVSDKPGETMLQGEGKNAWGLKKVSVVGMDGNGPAPVRYNVRLRFELDKRGAELFAAFTKANIKNILAIVVDSKVISAPVIMTQLGKHGEIFGRLTEQEAKALVKALKIGMPPVKQSTTKPPAKQHEGLVSGKLLRESVSLDVPDTLQIKRNDLLSKAGSHIRKGLIDLAKQFPQLKKSTGWVHVLRPMENSPDRLEIRLYYIMPKSGPDPTPQRDRFHITLTIVPPPPPKARVFMKPLYPNLGLVGKISVWSGNPELDAALKRLVAEALAPLKELNNKVGQLTTTKPTKPLAWRDKKSNSFIGISMEEMVKRLGAPTSIANAEPPDNIAVFFYGKLRPGMVLMILKHVREVTTCDTYWCKKGNERRASHSPPPLVDKISTTPRKEVDLIAIAGLLTKKVGGRWEVGLNNAFPESFRVLRGRIYSGPGKVLVNYILFPIGPKDTEYQRTLATAYEKANGVRCLGATEQFIVLEFARGDKASEWSNKVAKTLKLQPFSLELTVSASPTTQPVKPKLNSTRR